MNIRKNVDYSAMFAAIDTVIEAEMQQMELYCEFGRIVSSRPEKGAAVAATEYLSMSYPDVSGFSPRNLRRMRDFYRMYQDLPSLMRQAMRIGWTQNVVIMEAKLTIEERAWYLQAAERFAWSKAELTEKIRDGAHLEIALDESPTICYTESSNNQTERFEHDQDSFPLSWEDLPGMIKYL